MINRFLYVVTGASSQDTPRVLLAFLALCSLMSSYYFIKPLRKGLFFSEFSADMLPYFHLGVILLVIITTALLAFFSRNSNYKKVIRIFLYSVLLINAGFGYLIISPSKITVASFSLWSSTYFPLCMALFWGGLNRNFNCTTSKQSYAFIWIGAVAGAYFGSQITSLAIRYYDESTQMIFSLIFLLISILLLEKFFSLSQKIQSAKAIKSISFEHQQEASKTSNIARVVMEIFKDRYVRCIAILVISLTFSRGVFDLQSDRIIENELSRQLFQKYFVNLIPSKQNNIAENEWRSEVYEFVTRYKNLHPSEQYVLFEEFKLLTRIEVDFQKFQDTYQSYRSDFKKQVTLFNADVWLFQNLISMILLLICKIKFIEIFGMLGLLICLPVTYSAVFLIFMGNVNLELIFALKVLILALDYSLNNTAKEMLFVPLDQVANITYKPVIEGPLFKIGAASASTCKIVLDQILQFLSMSKFLNLLFATTALIVALNWIRVSLILSQSFNLKNETEHI